jgi:hypothetical protein
MNSFPKYLCTAVLVCVAFVNWGCPKSNQAAKTRVLNSLNPPKVLVSNGQAAILKVPDGYVSLVITTDWERVSFGQKFSATGDFTADKTAGTGGVFEGRRLFTFHGAKVWIGDGGADSTWVALDYGDKTSGIALSPVPAPNLKEVQALSFATNTPVNAQDLGRSIRVQ